MAVAEEGYGFKLPVQTFKFFVGIDIKVGEAVYDCGHKLEKLLGVEEEHEEESELDLLALVDAIKDVLEFYQVPKMFLQLLPVVVGLLDFVFVVFPHARLEHLDEFAQNYHELFAFVVRFGQRKFIAQRTVRFVLLLRAFVEL